MTESTPVGSFSVILDKLLFLGIVYQPSQSSPFFPVNLEMHQIIGTFSLLFLRILLAFMMSAEYQTGWGRIANLHYWAGACLSRSSVRIALYCSTTTSPRGRCGTYIKCRNDLCMPFWNVQVLICLCFLCGIFFSCSLVLFSGRQK